MRGFSKHRGVAGRAVLLALVTAAASSCDLAPRSGAGPAEDTAATASPGMDTAAPSPPVMAVTIDDLPWVGAVRPGETREHALARLADTLAAREVPALGFVNCDRAGAGGSRLRPWMDAGLDLGNHTAAHLDLNDAPLEQWLRDVRSCHEFVRELTDDSPVTFRYPFLHQGPTRERQAAALAVLEELESPIAHVTIDNSDWILAVAYGDAVRAGDDARAAEVGNAFVEHILRATEHYQQVAREKVGRDVPHVLLLHANLLVADHIDTLLARLESERGFRFVSVEAAQRDPVYSRADGYTGGEGLSWLYRMEPSTPELQAWDDAEARRLRQRWRQPPAAADQ